MANWAVTLCWVSFILTMEVIDLTLDWEFYTEINSTEQNIHHKTELRKAILAFAIFGTITFLPGLFGHYFDWGDNNKHLTYSTVMSVICTWIEDFPQIIIAVIIAVWSSELISNVQYAKAGYAICEALVQIALSYWQCCCRGNNDNDAGNPICLTFLLMLDVLGGFVILGCSIFLLVELKFDNYQVVFNNNTQTQFNNNTQTQFNNNTQTQIV